MLKNTLMDGQNTMYNVHPYKKVMGCMQFFLAITKEVAYHWSDNCICFIVKLFISPEKVFNFYEGVPTTGLGALSGLMLDQRLLKISLGDFFPFV